MTDNLIDALNDMMACPSQTCEDDCVYRAMHTKRDDCKGHLKKCPACIPAEKTKITTISPVSYRSKIKK